MNIQEFTAASGPAAKKAQETFEGKVSHMEFFVWDNGTCTTFIQESGRTAPIYQYYQFDNEKEYWRPTHILQGENWLKPVEVEEKEIEEPSTFIPPPFWPSDNRLTTFI